MADQYTFRDTNPEGCQPGLEESPLPVSIAVRTLGWRLALQSLQMGLPVASPVVC